MGEAERTYTGIGPENAVYFSPFLKEVELNEGVLALGAMEGGRAVGALAGIRENETASILSVEVAEESRRRGIAAHLMDAFLSYAEKAGCEYAMAVYPEREDLEGLFGAEGFWTGPAEPVISMDLKALYASPAMEKYFKMAGKGPCKSIAALTPAEKRGFEGLLLEAGFSRQDYGDLGIDPDLSFVLFEDDRPKGMVLAGRAGKQLQADLLYVRPGASRSDPIILLANMLKQAKELSYLKELCFTAMSESVRRLAESLLEEGETLNEGETIRKAVILLGDNKVTEPEGREGKTEMSEASAVKNEKSGEVREYVVSLNAILEKPNYAKYKDRPGKAKSLSSLSPGEFKDFMKYASEHTHLGAEPEYWEYEEDFSCVIQKEGRTKGFLLIRLEPEGRILMDDLVFAPGKNGDFFEMLVFSVKALSGRLPGEIPLCLRSRREEGHKLIEHFFPDIEYKLV